MVFDIHPHGIFPGFAGGRGELELLVAGAFALLTSSGGAARADSAQDSAFSFLRSQQGPDGSCGGLVTQNRVLATSVAIRAQRALSVQPNHVQSAQLALSL